MRYTLPPPSPPAGDVSLEEARWRDVAELRSGSKPQYQLQQELAAAVSTKQQELEDLLRVGGAGP